MTESNEFKQRTGIIGAAAGSLLLGLSAIPSAALATPVSQVAQTNTTTIPVAPPGYQFVIPLSQIRVADLPPYPRNPCPSIYYELPFSQRVVVPEVCRANAITQQLQALGLLDEVRERNASTGTPGVMGPPYTSYPTEVPPRYPAQ